MQLYQRVRTPCIGVCSTGIGDSVCRGCKRFDVEVIAWNAFSDSEKAAIDARLTQLLSQVVAKYCRITSAERLYQQLATQQIRYYPYRDDLCALFELLRAGASQIHDPSQFGFALQHAFAQHHLLEVKQRIEQEWYALSVAHYERYLYANQKRAVMVEYNDSK